MPVATAPIDTTVEVITPENIAFRYRVAGPFRRLPAYLLDVSIRLAIVVAIFVAMLFSAFVVGPAAIAVVLVAYFLVEWFYGGFFESYCNGRTPGKMVFGLRVLTVDGQPITPVQAVLRNLLRSVDMLPMLSWQILAPEVPLYAIPTFALCLASAAFSRRFQRIGDIVCGTLVVIEERKWLSGIARLEDPRTAQLAAYLPVDFRISRSLARALAAYVDRRRFFTPTRRREVARHLAEPLLPRFGLPADTSYDLLLCALYYRAFVATRADDEGAP